MRSDRAKPERGARAALQNAASIAGLMLTTEAVILDFPEDDTATAMPGAAGGMDF
jgi:chaperonin GroEL